MSARPLRIVLLATLVSFLPFLVPSRGEEAVVAADGSGRFTSVQEAINAAPQTASASNPWIIRIKNGTYKELIYAQREKRFVRLVGEDASKTVLTHNLHAKMIGLDGKEIGTFRTPTATLDADDFSVENLTIENSAGPVGQALAIRIDGDRVTFRHCRFLGWQDTIFANRGRQYFENCYIAGHVDFIFGGATAWFEKCELHCLKDGYVAAASTPEESPFGFVFSRCRLAGESAEVRTWLGRPWRAFASTIYLHCEMPALVRPAGWMNWGQPERERTARYAEGGCTGEGARRDQRVPWAKQLSEDELKAITIEGVLGGPDHWKP